MKHVLRNRLRASVIVTLKAGGSFRGVLYDHDRDALVLRNTQHLEGADGPTPVDGELVLLIADVAFIQLPG